MGASARERPQRTAESLMPHEPKQKAAAPVAFLAAGLFCRLVELTCAVGAARRAFLDLL